MAERTLSQMVFNWTNFRRLAIVLFVLGVVACVAGKITDLGEEIGAQEEIATRRVLRLRTGLRRR